MGPAIGIVIIAAVISIPAIYHFRRRRRDERLVRIWVDEQHYALLSLHGPKGWRIVFPGLGLLAGVRPGIWIYALDVQDEQGGQFSLNVQTSFLGGVSVQRL